MPSSPATPYANPALADRLAARSRSSRGVGSGADEFAVALNRSAAQRFAGVSPDARTVGNFSGIAALPRPGAGVGVRDGERSRVGLFRQRIPQGTLSIGLRRDAGDTIGPEIANSLYADLYGLRGEQDTRKSPFEYFLGAQQTFHVAACGALTQTH